MAQLNLHPCALQMRWSTEHPPATGEWENTLRGFLDDLGENCMRSGASLIGHIKGLATVADITCLQLNLVSENQPANVEGLVPDNTNELLLNLNLLVFGMSADQLLAAVTAGCEQVRKRWSGNIQVKILPAASDYPLALHAEGG